MAKFGEEKKISPLEAAMRRIPRDEYLKSQAAQIDIDPLEAALHDDPDWKVEIKIRLEFKYGDKR